MPWFWRIESDINRGARRGSRGKIACTRGRLREADQVRWKLRKTQTCGISSMFDEWKSVQAGPAARVASTRECLLYLLPLSCSFSPSPTPFRAILVFFFLLGYIYIYLCYCIFTIMTLSGEYKTKLIYTSWHAGKLCRHNRAISMNFIRHLCHTAKFKRNYVRHSNPGLHSEARKYHHTNNQRSSSVFCRQTCRADQRVEVNVNVCIAFLKHNVFSLEISIANHFLEGAPPRPWHCGRQWTNIYIQSAHFASRSLKCVFFEKVTTTFVISDFVPADHSRVSVHKLNDLTSFFASSHRGFS